MLNWKDFYGGEIVETDRIEAAKTKRDLKELLNERIRFYEDMLCDACSFQRQFEEKLGLNNIF